MCRGGRRPSEYPFAVCGSADGLALATESVILRKHPEHLGVGWMVPDEIRRLGPAIMKRVIHLLCGSDIVTKRGEQLFGAPPSCISDDTRSANEQLLQHAQRLARYVFRTAPLPVHLAFLITVQINSHHLTTNWIEKPKLTLLILSIPGSP